MDATLLLRGAWVGVGWDVNVHETEIAASQLPKRPAPLTAA